MAGSLAPQQLPPTPTPSLSNLSLAGVHNHSNPIDLTEDDDDTDEYIDPRLTKRMRVDVVDPLRNGSDIATFASRSPIRPSVSTPSFSSPGPIPSSGSFDMKPSIFTNPQSQQYLPIYPEMYRPAFAGPSNSAAFFPQNSHRPPPPPPAQPQPSAPTYQTSLRPSNGNVIDLTGSTPSPPPHSARQHHFQNGNTLPPDLDVKAPVCIGQLTATALVLYPCPYITQEPGAPEPSWVPVRLSYEHNPNKSDGSETIHIKIPPNYSAGSVCDSFGVVEQKVATNLGGMLGKGLIKIDAKVKKGPPNLPILALQMIVYTPKGNIPVVGTFMLQNGLLLDHPTPPYDLRRYGPSYYYNPHNPPPGGHNPVQHANNRITGYPNNNSRWTSNQVFAKSVEVQRSQVDEVFKSIRGGDQLPETEAGPEIATTLYPHQKKALTFLLEREREKPDQNGNFSSLWQRHRNPINNSDYWIHLVTQKEAGEEPQEAKGAILADDMGLGKTITCVSLIAATLQSANDFASSPISPPGPSQKSQLSQDPDPTEFTGSVWGMPDTSASSAKAKAKAMRLQERADAEFVRSSRIKTKSRATLIICPLSTVSNWEDQFQDHWKGEVTVFGGAGGTGGSSTCATPSSASAAACSSSSSSSQGMALLGDVKLNTKVGRKREGKPLRVYIYHGNARRPDPAFLADFDAVITTYATLASEYSKQNRSIANAEAEEEDESDAEGAGGVDVDEYGNQVLRLPKPKKGTKRKKASTVVHANEATSALQSIHWFRVVLDEAHCIKETGTVGSRASCDLVADRRLCLTGTPVQNKLDDVFALIKFLRLSPLDDKNVWTEWIGSPVKFAQPMGVARLQMVMKCITLRRTKESKNQHGQRILDLPPRRDELRYLKFDSQEQDIYNQFFNESKAEFTEMSDRNEVMKNYVGILQKILRLRQICDHFELVEGKGLTADDPLASMKETVAAIQKDGLTPARANVIFGFLREAGMTQCVECNAELCAGSENQDGMDDTPNAAKRPKKSKNSSRAPTRASSPTLPKAMLTRCQHLFCIGCYRQCVHPNWPEVAQTAEFLDAPCPVCQTPLQPADALEVKSDSLECNTGKKKPQKREKRQKGQALHFTPSTKVRALLGDLVQFSKANPYSANYDPDSLEIQMVDDKGNQLDDGVVKTVVFSQWTSMLDKIEDALESAGIRYDRLDGTMKRDDRTRAMDALKHEPSCEVLLVSLKAGGVGLNLTAAQRVYLMDPYWNPAVENQAVDRIHRLGQTRPVTTVKLIIENSIEARLLEVQKKKMELANMTLGQTMSKADMTARRMEELVELFT